MKKILDRVVFGRKNKIIGFLKAENETLKSENVTLETDLKATIDQNYVCLTDLTKVRTSKIKVDDELKAFKEKYAELYTKNRKINGKNMALKKKVKSLETELAKVTTEFEEFKKNKFIVRELKSGKTPKSTIKLKARTVQTTQIKNYMKDNFGD